MPAAPGNVVRSTATPRLCLLRLAMYPSSSRCRRPVASAHSTTCTRARASTTSRLASARGARYPGRRSPVKFWRPAYRASTTIVESPDATATRSDSARASEAASYPPRSSGVTGGAGPGAAQAQPRSSAWTHRRLGALATRRIGITAREYAEPLGFATPSDRGILSIPLSWTELGSIFVPRSWLGPLFHGAEPGST